MKKLLFILLFFSQLVSGQKVITYPSFIYYYNLNFLAEGRSGLTLPATFGSDATILTPVYKSSDSDNRFHTGNKTRADEKVFDGNDYTIYLKFLPTADNSRVFLFGGGTDNAKRGIEIRKTSSTAIYVYAADDIVNKIYNAHTSLTLTDWTEILIQINGTTKEMVSTVYHAGGTSVKTLDISAFTFNDNNNDANWGDAYAKFALTNIKKFSGIKTIDNCRLSSYVTDLQMWYPEVFSGTDVSGNNNYLGAAAAMDNDDKYYADNTTYLLDNGYSIYRNASKINWYIPHDINGNVIDRTVYQRVRAKSVDGNADYFNLADAMIEFQGDAFDRSNTTIYTDEARLNYYDAANPKRWHSEELNRLIMNDYFNDGYKGIIFPSCSSNSYDDRGYLKEIFAYNTNKSGSELNAVLSYTGDLAIDTMIYLKTPYTQVPFITAVENSEFTIQINNSIFYSYADIKAKTDLIQEINEDEDFMSKIYRWVMSNSAFCLTTQLLSLYQDGFVIVNEDAKYLRLPFLFMNSYPYGRCAELAQFAYGVIENYSIASNNAWKLGGVGHMVDNNADAYIDPLYGILLYSGKYETANVTEIEADKYLWTEPLRIYDYMYRERGGTDFTEAYWNEISGGSALAGFSDTPDVDNMTMKLPATATLTLPVKTANVPQTDQGENLTAYNHGVVNAATGVTGDVDMPFILLQVTGTGAVIVDDTTYTLPADEATLKTKLQLYTKFYHAFEITANTGGIEAEYLVSPRLLQLYSNNNYYLNIISGDVEVSKVTTSDIAPTFIANINTNDDDITWSITQDEFFQSNSILVPTTGEGASESRFVYYYKDGLRPPIDEVASNSTTIQEITAGTSVYDDCFAPIMTPKVDDFSGSLEITLTSVDDANIYYTTDGSDPDATDTLYSAPFTISATTTVKAICIKTDYGDSNIISREITKL